MNVGHDEEGGESIKGDDHEDLLDDLNQNQDSEVMFSYVKFRFLFFVRVIRKIISISLSESVHNGRKSRPNRWKKFFIVSNNSSIFASSFSPKQ